MVEVKLLSFRWLPPKTQNILIVSHIEHVRNTEHMDDK